MSVKPEQLQSILDARAMDFADRGRDIFAMNQSYVNHFREWKNRIRTIDNLQEGRWSVVYPDNQARTSQALIADTITSDLGDVGLLAGGKQPTVLCDARPKRKNSMEAALKEATLRQQVISNYRHRSDLELLRPELAMDLAGAGAACLVVWPDLYQKPEERFPRFIRKDPRYIFPDPDYNGSKKLQNMTVSYRTKARALAASYPGLMRAMWTQYEINTKPKEADNTELEVIEFYGPDICLKIAALDRSANGKKDLRVVPLNVLEHNLGQVLAVLGVRSAFDGQFRGQFDNAVAPLHAANEMYTLMLENFDRFVHSKELWAGEFDNPQDDGPGARITTDDPNARIYRVSPDAVSPQAFAMVAQSLDFARSATGIPSARSGEGLPSIISAQGVDRVQGKLTTQIAYYQQLLSNMERQCNSLALMEDEKLLGRFTEEDQQKGYGKKGEEVTKSIAGITSGVPFEATYKPVSDIKGSYENRVEFGAGAALDARHAMIETQAMAASGFISKRKARAELLRDEDVMQVERDLYREQMDESILAGLREPTTPIATRLRARQLLDQNKDFGQIAEELLSSPEMQPAEPEPAIDDAQMFALEKGGIPGKAATGPPAAFPPLPASARRPA